MQKILVVVDMQHDFIDGSLGSETAKNVVLPNVINKILQNRKNHEALIFTRDTHSKSYIETFEGKNLPIEHCIKNTDGWQIHKDIQNLPVSFIEKCITLDKPTFGSIDLKNAIKELVENDDFEIEICGLCTDICVVSNALILRTLFPETKISVDSKATSGTNDEAYKAALTVMQCCQIEII